MARGNVNTHWVSIALICVAALPAAAQSFRVQCLGSTITHPRSLNNNNQEPSYTGPTTLSQLPVSSGGYMAPTANVNGAIKCQ